MIGDTDPREPPVESTIGLVRDFINTVEWQVDQDEWRTPQDLGAWLTHRTGVAAPSPSEQDLILARRLREGLRSVLLAHAGHDPLPTSIDDLNAALAVIPLRMSFDASAALRISVSHSNPTIAALGGILDAVAVLRNDGSWMRLKACARDSCRWAYVDTSRNGSGRWCSMAGCGNFVKMGRRDGRETILVSEPNQARVPTLVDVAGRAGVSIKTVSNVVTGAWHVAEPTRVRVQAAVDELGYRPNLAARALRARREVDDQSN